MVYLNFFLLFLISLFVRTNSIYFDDEPFIEYMKTDLTARTYYHPFYNQTIEFVNKLTKTDQINEQCRSDLVRLINGIQSNELWALKFLQSTGFTIDGRLNGRTVNFGAFDNCVQFRRDETKNVEFDGKYCLVSLHTPEQTKIKQTESYKKYQSMISDRSKRLIDFNLGNAHGVCIPHTCKIEELVPIVNKFFEQFNLNIQAPKRCTTASEPEPLTNLQIISLLILMSLVILVILSVFFKDNKFLSNFSPVDSYNSIHYINPKLKLYYDGLKFYILFCGVLTHTSVLLGVFYSQPFAPIKEGSFVHYLRAFLGRYFKAVDVLFFFSGFFVIYSIHDLVKGNKMKYDLRNVFLMKYVRYFKILVIMILLTFILPLIGNGPYYSDYTNHLVDSCKENYWKNLLLISNFMSSNRVLDMCIHPAWHLSAEFQCNLFHYFVIYYMIKRPKLGFSLLIIQNIFVAIFNIIYIEYNQIDTWDSVLNLNLYDLTSFEHTYFPSIFYFNIYSFGIVCGWLVRNNVKPKLIDYKGIRILIWSFVVLIIAFTFYFADSYDQAGLKPGKLLRIIWPFYFKFSITLLHFWMIYSFSFGYSRPIKAFFSLKWFAPWAKLALSVPLIQFLYLHYSLASTRNIFLLNTLAFFKEITATFVFTWLAANLVFLFLENPIDNLIKNFSNLKRRQDVGVEKTKEN